MSALTTQEQELYDLALASLPDWFSGDENAEETVAGFAKMFGKAWAQIDSWVDMVFLKRAFGVWLEAHARDRGTSRQAGEGDGALGARLVVPSDAVTKPALIQIADAILVGAGRPAGTVILETRQEQDYWQTDVAVEQYWGKAGRWHNSPHAIMVELPAGTPAATVAAVAEAMRLFAAGGVDVVVEAQLASLPQLVTVTPAAAQVAAGGAAINFAFQSRLADTVSWRVNGLIGGSGVTGVVSGSGVFTPPLTKPFPEDVEVEAVSVLDSTVVGRARVKIL
jgi:hypothetical protein